MKAKLVRIGNSRGIRLPAALIEQCGFTETVDIRVEENRLIVTAEPQSRQGWADAFRLAPPPANDELLLDRVGENRFDEEEWNW